MIDFSHKAFDKGKKGGSVKMAISITFNNVDVKQGSAAEFRSVINTNFNNVKSAFTQVGSEFDKVYNTMVDVKVQNTQPSGQKSGDLWFKIV